MKNYKCTNHFTSSKTYKTYTYGQVISEKELETLPYHERSNFTSTSYYNEYRTADDELDTVGSIIDAAILFSSFSTDDFSSSDTDSSSDFGGFGGGDSGGGGASGDW